MLRQAQDKSLSFFSSFFSDFSHNEETDCCSVTFLLCHSTDCLCALFTESLHMWWWWYKSNNNNYRNIANIFQWNCNYSTINTIATTTRKWIKKQTNKYSNDIHPRQHSNGHACYQENQEQVQHQEVAIKHFCPVQPAGFYFGPLHGR